MTKTLARVLIALYMVVNVVFGFIQLVGMWYLGWPMFIAVLISVPVGSYLYVKYGIQYAVPFSAMTLVLCGYGVALAFGGGAAFMWVTVAGGLSVLASMLDPMVTTSLCVLAMDFESDFKE